MNRHYFVRRRQPLPKLLPILVPIVLALVMSIHSLTARPVLSSWQPGSPVPVIEDQMMGTKPDWAQITLRTLPAILEAGSFQVPTDLIRELGYDPSRDWEMGQTADQYMFLGDFQDSFQLQQFSLYEIAALAGLDIDTLRLADLALVGWQTIGNLIDAIPDLANRQLQEIEPIADLLTGVASPQDTLAEVIQEQAIADLSLSELNLEQYDLPSIPGIQDVPLENFQNWQQTVIEDIPGLADVPFADFPNPIAELGVMVGMVDVVFGTAEGDRNNTISGSYVEGFNVPCDAECAHLEMGQPQLVEGTQWISGKYQQVRGGKGVLASVNGGLEPTGRHPFGNAFKVVVLETDEATGIAETGLYFRMCVSSAFVDLGCTPYFIGPIPWLPVQEEGMMFLGQVKEGLSSTASAEVASAKGIDPQTGEPSPMPTPVERSPGEVGVATGEFDNPAPGYSVTSGFGYRTHPVHGDRRLHAGVDLGTPTGTVVQAADGGEVTFADVSGSLTTGYGRLVIVDHGNGYETYYAHLQGFFVQAGDIIAQGDPIGRADSSGYSTGPHLHFEVRQNGQPQNPIDYLR